MTTPANLVTSPHFAWPFRLGRDGAFAVVEQDSIDDIEQCVVVLVSTELGSREELPAYGIIDPTFTTQVDTFQLQQAVDDWEDRATIDVDQTIDSVDTLRRNVRISVGGG